jgi:hypothetical protein
MPNILFFGIAALCGTGLSLLIGFGSAYALAGAGHGWCSSGWSILSILFLPMLSVGFLVKTPKSARKIARYVVICCLAVDLLLLVSTTSEGWHVVSKVWDAVPSLLIVWIAIWAALHVAIALLWRKAFLRTTI